MSAFIDLVGQRFGRLTVIERGENDKRGEIRWLCRCDCGNLKVVYGSLLRKGKTRSCGCLRKEVAEDKARKHGGSTSRLYNIWKQMRKRCYNANNPVFRWYGGRGITVCQEWRGSFEAFRDWALANGYRDDLTIDRFNNEQGYFPENCRWATEIEQANNTRKNRFFTFAGETRTVAEWARIKKVSSDLIRDRLNLGWPIERALTEPIHQQNRKKK